MLRFLRLLGVVVVPVFASFGCANAGLKYVENAFVYRPPKHGPFNPLPSPPPGIEDVFIDNPGPECRLNGWYAEAENPRAVVLYCHGNANDLAQCRESLLAFRDQLGVSILAFDYSGYGRSDGKPSEENLYRDARTARKWLARRANVPESEIVLCGYSLGGGVAVELASKEGAKALILERTFTSIPDVAERFVPWLPMQSLMVNRYESKSKIANYHGPLLQTHGDADRVVPYVLGVKLHATANEPKEFVRVCRGRHADPPHPSYIAALDVFIGSLKSTSK
jgi:fermentation-respiration switch protein FrsA (DUF1100 family)